MAIHDFAVRHTYGAITVADAAGAVTAASGGSVTVRGILVLNTTADTVWTVYDSSDTVLFTWQMAVAKTSLELTTPWLADAGIKVGNDKGTGAATIFHSNAGA